MNTVEKEKLAKSVSLWIAQKLDADALALHEAAEIGFTCLGLLDIAPTTDAFKKLVLEQDPNRIPEHYAKELSRSIIS